MRSIYTRRSIRKYQDKKVSEEDLKRVLKAGMFAPSAGNQQPWEFIVLNDQEIINKIAKVHPYSSPLVNAQLGIVVCGNTSQLKYDEFWQQDCSAAIENILLEADSINLGTCWMGVYPVEKLVASIKKILALPEHVEPFGIISIGYPAEQKQQPNRFNEQIIHYNQYNHR
jgi:nitroreductase